MNRRAFFGALAALPLAAAVKPKADPVEFGWRSFEMTWTVTSADCATYYFDYYDTQSERWIGRHPK